MSRGGARKGAGRKRGGKNRASIEREKTLAEGGITPLDYLLDIMRDPNEDVWRRIRAAIAAAPYCHPRLATVEHTGRAVPPAKVVLEFIDPAPSEQDVPKLAAPTRIPWFKTTDQN